jgi:FAD/FMN-containing dehydrogenase
MDEELANKFAAIVGENNVLRKSEDMQPYLTEWRDRYRGAAAMVLRPGNVAEISQIMALASATGTFVVPQGGNTGLVGGQIAFDADDQIVVSTTRLNQVRSVDTVSNTMTVEAGITLYAIQQLAKEHKRLFPLSLASEGSCQIGGNLASNAGGVGVLAYGNTRDLVMGLEVVLADGRVWNGLRALKKDNTGYDLKSIFIGSEGTLGIITAAVLKLFPEPEAQTTIFAGLAGLEEIGCFFDSCRAKFGHDLTAFEILPRIGMDFVLRHKESARLPLNRAHEWYVLLEISGTPADMEVVLGEAFEQGIIEDATIAASIAQSEDFWALREAMSEVQKHEGGSIKHDISVPVSSINDFITTANAVVTGLIPGCRPVPFGHFGDGNIHYNISQPADMDKRDFLSCWDEVNARVYELVIKLGGSISAEHGIGVMKRDLLAMAKDPVELDIMRDIKQALDPQNIMNPGKVL